MTQKQAIQLLEDRKVRTVWGRADGDVVFFRSRRDLRSDGHRESDRLFQEDAQAG